MVIRAIRNAILMCTLSESIVSLHAAQQDKAKDAPVARSDSPGAELYKQHCVVCHGNDLKGVGPVPAPYRVPPDLTKLARRHGGKFPDIYVADVLRSGVILPEHGPAQMPVWGTDFREMDGLDSTQVQLRITNLTKFLNSRQSK